MELGHNPQQRTIRAQMNIIRMTIFRPLVPILRIPYDTELFTGSDSFSQFKNKKPGGVEDN